MRTYGLDVVRGYELSWLNLAGKPEIACMELQFPLELGHKLDTMALKEYLNGIINTKFASDHQVKEAICQYLCSAVGAKSVELSLQTPNDFYTDDISLRSTALDNFVSHNVRFICDHTAQPFTGSILIDYFGDSVDAAAIECNLLELRNLKANPQSYADKMLSDNCVVSLHLARKGGFSWQLLRSTNPEVEFELYVQRSAVE